MKASSRLGTSAFAQGLCHVVKDTCLVSIGYKGIFSFRNLRLCVCPLCLADPPKPQYRGGIIRNPEFNNGTKRWKPFGRSRVAVRKSESGNRFSVATSRTSPQQSISQKVFLQKGLLYAFSAWVQVDRGNAAVRVVFKTSSGFIHAGETEAKSGCWTMLKGGLTPESSGPAEIFFESENRGGEEIWVDSVSLQPFTERQWRAHQAKAIDKVRKKSVVVRVVDGEGKAVPGASVSIQQVRPGFPFGCAIASTILNNPAYQNWFSSRFTVTTFENEMKWYATETSPGKEDYSAADAMLAFTKQHGIAVRGHNVLWDDPQTQMGWVKSLSAQQLRDAAQRRLNSVVSRYKGQVIAWDVVNENMHGSFFEDKLGADASSIFYQKVREVDPNALLFLNEYNTLEYPGDLTVTPAKYLEKLQRIEAYTNHPGLAIGLESHFGKPDLAYMRAALDTLARANRSIWLTEVDVHNGTERARDLEGVLREGYSHPAVKGIVMWSAWHPNGCYRMCLTDNNFKNLPAGDVVDKLIAEWKSGDVVGKTAADGSFRARLFHGDYEISISQSSGKSSSVQSFKVADSPHRIRLKIRIQGTH
ncbi:endo-1,4-beta-xylanase 5-like [Zingiber officinale]|uniref:endo-1,4-beta-xylanase 5-like n=1 Tax=Zingiber officinale TaxID=94328 RepID=UPI001C4B3B32|nr:endo-1,4-beta-xylanase 5-like [Zingiber officinale]